MNWTLLRNSLLVSALTTLLAATMGLVSASFLNGLSLRWRRCFIALAVLALALPPFLTADCWMTLFARSGWRGKWGTLSLDAPDENIRQLVLAVETRPTPPVLVSVAAWETR